MVCPGSQLLASSCLPSHLCVHGHLPVFSFANLFCGRACTAPVLLLHTVGAQVTLHPTWGTSLPNCQLLTKCATPARMYAPHQVLLAQAVGADYVVPVSAAVMLIVARPLACRPALQACMRRTRCCWRRRLVQIMLRPTWAACLTVTSRSWR